MFLNQPPEIQLRVLNYLSFGDILRLVQVNHHMSHFVKPETWSQQEKAAFVKRAQHYKQHNLLSVNHLSGGLTQLIFDANGFACYSCYRVIPRESFSISQTRKFNAKNSPRDLDDSAGCGRFCIDCGIARDVYRASTRIRAVYDEWYTLSEKGTMKKVDLAFCPGCRAFSYIFRSGLFDEPTDCDTCKVNLKLRKHHYSNFVGSFRTEMTRFVTCPQCNETSLGCDAKKRACVYCKGDLCQSCGCMTSNYGKWWCGLNCSKAAWMFLEKMINDGWPIETVLRTAVEGKRTQRKIRLEADVLEEDIEEDALALLEL